MARERVKKTPEQPDSDKGDSRTVSMLVRCTSEIVSAQLNGKQVDGAEIPGLIRDVYGALESLGRPNVAEKPQPAVPVRRSVHDDYIVCLEDGKKLKMLKRHLKTTYNMTPEEYREKWGLPPDYPMVAPSYTRQRQELARRIGLGTTRQ